MSTLQDKMNALSPAQRKSVQNMSNELIAEELALQELRQKLNLTQEMLAESLEVRQQDNASRVAKWGDVKISTLHSYVEALGGQLNVTVTLPDQEEEIRLSVAAG